MPLSIWRSHLWVTSDILVCLACRCRKFYFKYNLVLNDLNILYRWEKHIDHLFGKAKTNTDEPPSNIHKTHRWTEGSDFNIVQVSSDMQFYCFSATCYCYCGCGCCYKHSMLGCWLECCLHKAWRQGSHTLCTISAL